ncbi:hypothetical protein BKA93DRAFT_452226 [Sparassis latifolia]
MCLSIPMCSHYVHEQRTDMSIASIYCFISLWSLPRYNQLLGSPRSPASSAPTRKRVRASPNLGMSCISPHKHSVTFGHAMPRRSTCKTFEAFSRRWRQFNGASPACTVATAFNFCPLEHRRRGRSKRFIVWMLTAVQEYSYRPWIPGLWRQLCSRWLEA